MSDPTSTSETTSTAVTTSSLPSELPSDAVASLMRLIEAIPEWKEVDWTTLRGAMDGVRIAMVVVNGKSADGGDKHEAVVAVVKKAQSLLPELAIWDTLIPMLDDFIAAQKTMLKTDLNATQRMALAAASATCTAMTRCICSGKTAKDRAKALPKASVPKRRTTIPPSAARRPSAI